MQNNKLIWRYTYLRHNQQELKLFGVKNSGIKSFSTYPVYSNMMFIAFQ